MSSKRFAGDNTLSNHVLIWFLLWPCLSPQLGQAEAVPSLFLKNIGKNYGDKPEQLEKILKKRLYFEINHNSFKSSHNQHKILNILAIYKKYNLSENTLLTMTQEIFKTCLKQDRSSKFNTCLFFLREWLNYLNNPSKIVATLPNDLKAYKHKIRLMKFLLDVNYRFNFKALETLLATNKNIMSIKDPVFTFYRKLFAPYIKNLLIDNDKGKWASFFQARYQMVMGDLHQALASMKSVGMDKEDEHPAILLQKSILLRLVGEPKKALKFLHKINLEKERMRAFKFWFYFESIINKREINLDVSDDIKKINELNVVLKAPEFLTATKIVQSEAGTKKAVDGFVKKFGAKHIYSLIFQKSIN